MPTYRYVAYTEKGEHRRGRVEGLNPKDVREQLLRRGLYAREVKGVRGANTKLSAARRAVMYRELSSMLTAGLPLEQALEILSERAGAGGGDVLPDVRDRIREGVAFSEALAARIPEVRGREEAVLAAGEASGGLDRVTEELAETLEEESALAEEVRSALTYPAVVCALAVVVLGVMVGVLLPVYERLLSGLDRDLPALTRGILALGRGARHPVGWVGLGVGTALAGFGVHRARRRPGGVFPRYRFEAPVAGGLFRSLARTRFARTLALLLEGGVGLPEALRTAGRATGSTWLGTWCLEAAERVSHGERLAAILGRAPVLGEELPGWVRAGESSGNLAPLLRHAARASQREWERRMRRAMGLLEPLLILLVGGLILLVALAVLLPMLRLNQGLGA